MAPGPDRRHVMQPAVSLVGRLAALLGGFAHAVGTVLRGLFWFAPAHWPWALLMALLLAVGAWQSVVGTRALEAAQPRPEPLPLGAVAVGGETGWVGTSSVVRGPFMDSSAYGAEVLRHYYLLLDPRDPSVAMVARSTERLEERRTRTIVARVEADPALVAGVATALEEAADGLDPELHLVELPDPPDALVGDAVDTPVTLDAEPGDVVTLRGEFAASVPATGGDGREYVVRTGGRSVVVRSPHDPERLPVDVWGVGTTDPPRVQQALEVPALAAELGDRNSPTGRLLAEGVSPPLADISYLPAMVLAALALLLATGWALGYPVFSRRPLPATVRAWPLEPGDEVPIEVFGVDRRGGRRAGLEGAPGRLERLPIDEMERRAWQYSLHDGRAAPSATSDVSATALALSSGQGPLLVRLDPAPTGIGLAGGALVEVRRARPALRLRGDGLDIVATFASPSDRDRALAAITPSRWAGVPDGPARPGRVEAPPPQDADATPLPVRASAIVLAVVALLVVVAGVAGLPGAIGAPESLPPALAQIGVGLLLGLVARGVWLRRDWAGSVGFNVAWVGAAVAALIALAAPQCGLWLSPNLAACQAAGPLGVIAAVGAAIGLAYAALALARHPAVFTR